MDLVTLQLIFATVFGAIIGSFLSVCIYRLPLGRFEKLDAEGNDIPITDEPMSLVDPVRSICPTCKKQLTWWQNIPILSWLLLGGKCGFCKAPISARYPAVEILTAFFGFYSLYRFGVTPTAAVVFALMAVLLVISAIDIDYFIIPDTLSIGGTVVAFILIVTQDLLGKPIFAYPIVDSLWMSYIGWLAGFGFLYVIAKGYTLFRKKEGLGFGDIKLLGLLGALLGPEGALNIIFLGSLIGAVLGIVLMMVGGKKWGQYIPFGPYLAAAAMLYVLFDVTLFMPGRL